MMMVVIRCVVRRRRRYCRLVEIGIVVIVRVATKRLLLLLLLLLLLGNVKFPPRFSGQCSSRSLTTAAATIVVIRVGQARKTSQVLRSEHFGMQCGTDDRGRIDDPCRCISSSSGGGGIGVGQIEE